MKIRLVKKFFLANIAFFVSAISLGCLGFCGMEGKIVSGVISGMFWAGFILGHIFNLQCNRQVKKYEEKKNIVSEETSATMRMLLESVVSEGSGKNAYIEGYEIGGKTATSQTLPRSANRYISSFIGFAPADDPQVLGMCVIYDPQGVYYGGTIAAPVVRNIFESILPYLGIEKE